MKSSKKLLLHVVANSLIACGVLGVVGLFVVGARYVSAGTASSSPASAPQTMTLADDTDSLPDGGYEVVIPGVAGDTTGDGGTGAAGGEQTPGTDEPVPAPVPVMVDVLDETGGATDGCTADTYAYPAPEDQMVTVGFDVDCSGSWAATDEDVDHCALYNSSGQRLVGIYGNGVTAADVPLADGEFRLLCDRKIADPSDAAETLMLVTAQLTFTVSGPDPANTPSTLSS